jgi:hypothetical protein
VDAATAQTHLDAWLAADSAVSLGQTYTISTENGSRSLSRVDSAEIRNQITFWSRQVQQATAQAAGVRNPGVSTASFGG